VTRNITESIRHRVINTTAALWEWVRESSEPSDATAQEIAFIRREQSSVAQTWVSRILMLSVATWVLMAIPDEMISRRILLLVAPTRISIITFMSLLLWLNTRKQNLNYQYIISVIGTAASAIAVSYISLLYEEHHHGHYYAFVLILIAGLGFFPFGPGKALILISGVLAPYIVITALWGHIIDPTVFMLINIYLVASAFMLFVMRLNHQQHILRELRMRYKLEGTIGLQHTIIENADEGMAVFDEHMTVIEANKRFYSMHGGEDSKKLHNLDELYSVANRNIIRKNIMGLEPGESALFELEYINELGKQGSMEVSAQKMQINSKYMLVAFYRDISERKMLYQQTANAQQLESLAQMAFGISHDFKNVLATMQAYAEFIKYSTGLEGETYREAVGRNTEIIQQEIEQARTLVTNLISLGGNKTAQYEPVLVNDIVNYAVRLYSAIMSDIKFESDLSPNIPPVEGSTVHLRQVLVNLLINARDAMNGVGSIRIATSLAESPATGDSPLGDHKYCAKIIVVDTGSGIESDNLAHIFQPFYSTKKQRNLASGTGLGLAIVDSIIKSHGGTITVESKKGEGAMFTILLPCGDPLLTLQPAESGR